MSIGFLTLLMTSFSPLLMTSKALLIGAVIAKFVLVIAICFTNNEKVGNALFVAFAGITGLVLHPILYKSGIDPNTVWLALGLTVVLFVSLTCYAIYSGRDFNAMGGFLFAALLLLVAAGIINLFIGSSIMQLALAWISLVIFSGFVLWDTDDIIRNGHERTTAQNALSLFLNVLNIFLSLLRILKD